MSRVSELQDQLKQKGIEYGEKIRETELYQKISEKYASLSPPGQKLARYVTVFVTLMVLMSYPLTQLQVSSTFVQEFEAKRGLLRNMFKTYRESSVVMQMPQPPDETDLISQIQSTLSSSQLLSTQILSVAPTAVEGRLIPAGLVKSVVQVQLSSLNLRQTVEIGTQLANLSGSLKVKDLMMSASPNRTGYFDVTYKVYAFNVPQAPVEAPPEVPTKGRGKKAPDTTGPSEPTVEE